MARANQNKSISMPKPPGDSEGGFSVSPSDISAGGAGNSGAKPKDAPIKFDPIPKPEPPPHEPTPQENLDRIVREVSDEVRRKSGRR